MANSLKDLTRLGADTRKLAALLQSKGRGRDTVLAHITPQEASLLKARGGRGSRNPETGLLEFEDDVGPIEAYQEQRYGQFDEYTPASDSGPGFYGTAEAVDYPVIGPDRSFSVVDQPVTPVTAPGAETEIPAEFRTSEAQALARMREAPEEQLAAPEAAIPAGPQMPVPQVPGTPAGGQQDPFLRQMLAAGVAGLAPALLARRAAGAGREAAGQIGQLGAPYRAKGQELMGLAQAGQLTGAGQQQVEALRAQLAQQQAGRGGVGAAQAQQQVARFQQQLLQQQYDMGLKLSGISDQYALKAIQAGMSADQAANQMLGSTFANVAAIFAGQPRIVTPGG